MHGKVCFRDAVLAKPSGGGGASHPKGDMRSFVLDAWGMNAQAPAQPRAAPRIMLVQRSGSEASQLYQSGLAHTLRHHTLKRFFWHLSPSRTP